MPSRALDALVSGYSAAKRERKCFVMMQAYVEDSEGFKPGRILMLSAAIHAFPSWQKFTDEWQAVLDEKPAIKSFHMREARPLQGAFKGWNSIDRDLKIIRLVDVIMRSDPHVMSCWVSQDDYRDTVGKAGVVDVRCAYGALFDAIIMKVVEYQATRGEMLPVDFIFDEKGDMGTRALFYLPIALESLRPDLRPLITSTPVFRDDEDVLPLQGADLIAWHMRRRKEYPGKDIETAITERLDGLERAECQMTKDALKDLAAQLDKLPFIETARQEKDTVYKKWKRMILKGGKFID